MSNENFNVDSRAAGNGSQYCDYYSKSRGRKLEKLITWEIQEERQEFLRLLYHLVENWNEFPPNLQTIFRKQEVDWLLTQDLKDEPEIQDGRMDSLHRNTPLHYAFSRDESLNRTIVQSLFTIYQRFEVNYVDDRGITHFHVACKYGFKEIVKAFLMRGQNPDCHTQVSDLVDPPLHLAVDNNDSKIFETLLRKGANPNSTNSEKSTPMHIILKRFEEYSNSNIDFWITFLLKRGANSNLADKNGFTPLHVLCQYCLVEDPDTIKKFFELHEKFDRRIEVDARDNNKRTPLQWAIASHWPETVKFLLDRGADLRIFVFPTESHFDESRFGAIYDRDWVRHRLSLAASALFIVELLENRGYEMKQNDATTIMTIFNRWGLFDQPDIVDKRWYVRDERFVDKAKKIMVSENRSVYDLVQLGTREAAKEFNLEDYLDLVRSCHMLIPGYLRMAYLALMFDKITRIFFRKWTRGPFMEMNQNRLPSLVCDEVTDKLPCKDLWSICLAALI
ncbi:hypothetical protein TKK_0012666 [Trichogramma kaykai]